MSEAVDCRDDDADGAAADDSEAGCEPQGTAITTYLRIRPVKKPSGFFEPSPDGHDVQVSVPPSDASGLVNNARTSWTFGFSGGVLDASTTQDQVFDRIGAPVVASVAQGFNATVFAYGQTGSGKTYTLTGGADSYDQRGIIPRAISAMFKHAAATVHM